MLPFATGVATQAIVAVLISKIDAMARDSTSAVPNTPTDYTEPVHVPFEYYEGEGYVAKMALVPQAADCYATWDYTHLLNGEVINTNTGDWIMTVEQSETNPYAYYTIDPDQTPVGSNTFNFTYTGRDADGKVLFTRSYTLGYEMK